MPTHAMVHVMFSLVVHTVVLVFAMCGLVSVSCRHNMGNPEAQILKAKAEM